jgi:hypothetical protein
MRVDFTPVGLNEDGLIPLEAFDESTVITIFDRPVLEFLSRRKKSTGLEVTQLRLDAPSLLVESYMLALTHAALFHVQAHRHFADHDPAEGTKIPAYPGIAKGAPRPSDWPDKEIVGMRWPITRPTGGVDPDPPGIGFRDGYFIPFAEVGERKSGMVGPRTPTAVPEKPSEQD